MKTQGRVLVILGFQHGLFDEATSLRQCVEPPGAIDQVRSAITALASRHATHWESVVHVAMHQQTQPTQPVSEVESFLMQHQSLEQGSRGARVHESLSLACSDTLTLSAKPGRNAFHGSGLDQCLSKLDPGQIVMVGPVLGGMLSETCRTAYLLGYEISVPTDCLLACSAIELNVYLDSVLCSLVQFTSSSELLGDVA